MFRIRAVALLAVGTSSALALGACGNSGSSDTASSTAGTASTPVASAASSALKDKKIVYVPGLTGEPFYASVSCGGLKRAKELGGSFSTQGSPEFDVTKQTAVVNAVVASKPDALMISLTDTKALAGPLRQAKSAGIKVLTIDGDLADKSIAISNIQSDNIQGGKLAADRMGEVTGGKGTVVMIDNLPGFPITEDRQKGFKDEIKAKFPNMKVLDVQYSNNATAKAASIVTSSITAHPDLSGVYTLETNNTEGAATGVRESGKQGSVHVVGYDSSDPLVKALRSKLIDGLVVQYPYGEGIQGVQSIADAIAGKPVQRNQGAPFVIATPDNVDTPKVQKYLYKLDCSA